jgi:hypothetical protein
MPVQNEEGRQQRTLEEVKGTPRSGVRSIWRSTKEQVAVAKAGTRAAETGVPQAGLEPVLRPGPKPPMRERIGFLARSVFEWIKNFLGHVLDGRRRLPAYPPDQSGIYRMPNDVKIALASDWGTGTESAYAVGNEIAARHPDITIHLGDVYYSGTSAEYRRYFLPEGCWPRGARATPGAPGEASGTYVLNANHEMYSGGQGYFGAALPEFRQVTSYFCLENDAWRIVAMDTGYHCTRGIKKLLSFITGDKTKLNDVALDWTKKVFSSAPKPTILLSHHQPMSAFDKRVYPNLAVQLRPYLDRVALWFWGHEHKLAGYEGYAMNGGPRIRGRCIGHGGMPIELGWVPLPKNAAPVVFSDERYSGRAVKGTKLGFCGYAMLELHGTTLTVTYRDEQGRDLLREVWESGENGSVRGKAVERLIDDPQFHCYGDLARLLA